jgi:SAM-dependent methyltransferase
MLRFWDGILFDFYRSLSGYPAGTRLLDVGCGRGTLVSWAERDGLNACGVEPLWPAPLASSRVARAFGEQLPFADDTFDVVVSFSVLAHVRDPRSCLREIGRVMKPSGRAFVAVAELEGYPLVHKDLYTQITSERWLRELVATDGRLTVTAARRMGLKYAVPVLKRTAIRIAPAIGVPLLRWIYRRAYPVGLAELALLELGRTGGSKR